MTTSHKIISRITETKGDVVKLAQSFSGVNRKAFLEHLKRCLIPIAGRIASLSSERARQINELSLGIKEKAVKLKSVIPSSGELAEIDFALYQIYLCLEGIEYAHSYNEDNKLILPEVLFSIESTFGENDGKIEKLIGMNFFEAINK